MQAEQTYQQKQGAIDPQRKASWVKEQNYVQSLIT